MVRELVCFLSGTEMAHWLFWQTKTSGTCQTPAKFIASWKSPSEVAPSPKYAMTTASSPRYWAAYARPTAWGSWVATGIVIGRSCCSSAGWPPSRWPEQNRAVERSQVAIGELGLERRVEVAFAVEDRQVLDLEPRFEGGSGHDGPKPILTLRPQNATSSRLGLASRAGRRVPCAWPSP